jgi:hypothetical protein
MMRTLALFPLLLVAGCLAQRTYVVCTTCKKEPYIVVSELRFATQWGATCWNREAQPIDCAHGDYDVHVRCVVPCRAGECELSCSKREPEPGVITVHPWPSEGTAYTGPVSVEVTLHKHGTDRWFRYRSPTVWFSNEGMVLVCPDRRPGAVHPMVPCRYSGMSARRPLFAIAYERDRLFSTVPTWHLLDKARVNETIVTAKEKVPVGEDLEVPLFSLADVFPQFRTEGGGGLRPAHYRVSVAALASVPSARRPLELEELDVR